MKNILYTLGLCIAFIASVNAQDQDPKAKEILNKVSEKTKGYSTISATFERKTFNTDKTIDETEDGTFLLKSDKYFLSTKVIDIYCDGKMVWRHEKEEKEAYESSVEEAKENGLDFSKFLTIWEEGYKYKYEKEYKSGSETLYQIKLFPKNTEDSPFHTVVVEIAKSSHQVKKVTLKGKDGITTILSIKTFVPNKELEDTKFKFNKLKHRDVTIID